MLSNGGEGRGADWGADGGADREKIVCGLAMKTIADSPEKYCFPAGLVRPHRSNTIQSPSRAAGQLDLSAFIGRECPKYRNRKFTTLSGDARHGYRTLPPIESAINVETR
jgi:hypothetical protein